MSNIQLKTDQNNIIEFIDYLKEKDNINNILVYNNVLNLNYDPIYGFKYRGIKKLHSNKDGLLIFYVSELNSKIIKQINISRKNMSSILIIFDKNISLDDLSRYFNLDKNKLVGYINYDDKKLRQLIMLSGKKYDIFSKKVQLKSMLAIIHAYNEEDVIEETIHHLLNQGVDVQIYDNWSTDNTYNIVSKLAKKEKEHVFLTRFPEKKPVVTDSYDLVEVLKNVERTIKNTNYDWYTHYDADEIRISPIKGMTLQEYISYIDKLGYNAIENTVIDFRIVNSTKGKNIFNDDTYFEFGRRSGHFVQVKTYKRNINMDLASSGGHNCMFEGRKLFPLKILLKHYPLRTVEQAKQKIFKDRLPRYSKANRAIGWHIQYNSIVDEKDFIYDKNDLFKFDEEIRQKYFLEFLTGIGINKIK